MELKVEPLIEYLGDGLYAEFYIFFELTLKYN